MICLSSGFWRVANRSVGILAHEALYELFVERFLALGGAAWGCSGRLDIARGCLSGGFWHCAATLGTARQPSALRLAAKGTEGTVMQGWI